MKVAIVGSRKVENFEIDFDKYLPEDTTEIISGGAKGIDTLAEQYADGHLLSKHIIRPEYKRYGKAAPIRRNRQIVDCADLVIALWDGKSKGTKSTIEYAKRVNKPIQVYILGEHPGGEEDKTDEG